MDAAERNQQKSAEHIDSTQEKQHAYEYKKEAIEGWFARESGYIITFSAKFASKSCMLLDKFGSSGIIEILYMNIDYNQARSCTKSTSLEQREGNI